MIDLNNTNIKPRGYFNKFLMIDCETSGMNLGGKDITDGYQSIAWGVIVADAKTFKSIEEVYVEIKWDGKSKWESKAEKIHGLSRDYLAKHGVSEEEAVEKIAGLMYSHFKIEDSIVLAGQNVGRFDIHFFEKLLHSQGIYANFAHRSLDTFSVGFGTIGVFNSDDLFETLGIVRPTPHNALSDARAALDSLRIINKVFKRGLSL